MTTANLADGTVLNFPDGTSEEVISRVVKQHILKNAVSNQGIPTDTGMPEMAYPVPQPTTLGEKAIGAGEAALSAISGATTGTLGGMMNMLTTPSARVSAQREAEFKRLNPNIPYNPLEQKFLQGAERFTYAPRTQAGQEYIGNVGEVLQQSGLQGLVGMPVTPAIKVPKSVIKNTVKNQTLQQAQREGYIIPPSTTNPSALNKTLESIAGKDATKQAVSVKNQEVTDNLTKRALGLSQDTELTAGTLNDYRKFQAQVGYDPIRNLEGNFTLPTVKTVDKFPSATGKAITREVTPTISPSDAINQLSELRAKTNDAWNSYAKTSRGKERAKSLEKQTAELEMAIESNLKQRGLDDLIPQFRDARRNIAKSYTVSNAIVEGSGSVNAQKIASEFEKDKPLTGELAVIGSFANTFPNATMNPKYIGSQGVSKMQFGLGSILGGLGGIGGGASSAGLGFALPFVLPPLSKELILSSPYQKSFSIPAQRTPIPQRAAPMIPYAPYSGLLYQQDQLNQQGQ
jgi:hypothetical protein